MKSLLKNKKIIFVSGDIKRGASGFVYLVLKDKFSVSYFNRIPDIFDFFKILRSEIIILEDNLKDNTEALKAFVSSAENCFFIFTDTKKKMRTRKMLKGFSRKWNLALDYSIARRLKRKRGKKSLTFGMKKKSADFSVTDIHSKDSETNFKVSYKGKSIPFWINKKLKAREVYGVLPAICVAEMIGMNLAEVSQKLKKR